MASLLEVAGIIISFRQHDRVNTSKLAQQKQQHPHLSSFICQARRGEWKSRYYSPRKREKERYRKIKKNWWVSEQVCAHSVGEAQINLSDSLEK